MEVSGVLISCDTFVMSSVLKRSLFIFSETAASIPLLTLFKSSPCFLKNSISLDVSTGCEKSPFAIAFAAHLILSYCMMNVISSASSISFTIKTTPISSMQKPISSSRHKMPNASILIRNSGTFLSIHEKPYLIGANTILHSFLTGFKKKLTT